MSKRFTKLITLFTATMAVFSASAQVLPVNKTPRYPSRNLPRQKTEKPTNNLLKTFPTLLAKTLPRGGKTPFFTASIPLQTATPKNLVSVNPSLTMWGNLLTDDLLACTPSIPLQTSTSRASLPSIMATSMQEVDLLMAFCMVCSSTRVMRVWAS